MMKLYKRSADGPYWFAFANKGQMARQSTGVCNRRDATAVARLYEAMVRGQAQQLDPMVLERAARALKCERVDLV